MGSLVMDPDDITTYSGQKDVMKNFTTICMALGRIRSNGIFNKSNPFHFTFPLLLIQISLASVIILLMTKPLRPLGQPIIIPQILGGILLGPSLLGRSSSFSSLFFPLRSFIVLDLVSTFGYMFYFFLIGVQIDLWILKKIDKRSCIIGISTVGFALLLSTASAFLLTYLFKMEVTVAHSLPVIALTQSVLSFPIITQYLSELKIVNSEFGRVAISSSVVSTIFSLCVITLTVLLKEEDSEVSKMARTISCAILLAGGIVFVLRPGILWMVKHSPEGKPLQEECIYAAFVGILVSGFLSQATGLHIHYGPLVFGMSLPAGPPLGSALVDKLELINSWLFMPLFFVKNGLVINTFGVKPLHYAAVQAVILVSCFGKFSGALVPAIYSKMPIKDAVALGLVMNAQGILELGMFKMMRKAKAIDAEAFVVMCTSMVIVSCVITPLVRYLYNPSSRYLVYKKRTVMHSRVDSNLRLVVCIDEKEDVPATINFLAALNPSKRSPIEAYILHLVELVGRASPLLIAHKLTKRPSSRALLSQNVVNAFRQYEHNSHGIVSVHPYTSISSYATMHDNLCKMALDMKTSLIVVPYHKRFNTNTTLKSSKKGINIMNNNVLDKAPCSVAILIDRGLLHHRVTRPILENCWSQYRVAVAFLGGPDDREALAIGARMAGHPNINITIVRLVGNGNITSSSNDDTREKKLDNELVSEFRSSMTGNYRFMYVEEVVLDGSGTVAVIRSMENKYDLIIVGRSHMRESPLTTGLTDWNDENTDLGAIGDVLASADFLGSTTVLVVQQHNNFVENKCHEDHADSSRPQNFNIFKGLGVEEAEYVPMQRNSK